MSNRTWSLIILLVAILALTTIVALGMIQATSLRSPFRRVALKVSPAVVNISADKIVQTKWSAPNELDEFLQKEPSSRPPLRHQHILGTGFIFDKQGYVMTNYHVISGYEEIVIHLADGTEFAGDSVKKIGVDPWSDLAVLKIETHRKLPVARLGNSDNLDVGDWVAAVGNPFGLSGTLTAGVVSAFNRSGIPMSQGPQYQDFIQTDASINPGNSGGPLVNEDGDVVGINSAIRSPIRGSVGIGFAIPVNFARAVAEELIQNGRIIRGFLGLSTQPVDDKVQAALGLKTPEGVLVSSVDLGGPAARAGIQAGDVILQFGQDQVTDVYAFQGLAAGAEPGSEVTLGIRRWGRPLILKLRVEPQIQTEPPPLAAPSSRYWLGIVVRNPTPDETKRLRVPAGAIVTEIEPGSEAEEAQLKPGDVITAIDSSQVRDLSTYQQLAKLMARARRPLLFRVVRGPRHAWFAVEPKG
jgi:Do/DeqQ family serine protease